MLGDFLDRHFFRYIQLSILTIVVLVTVAVACGDDGVIDPDTTTTVNIKENVTEFTYILADGRKATCIKYENKTASSLSCSIPTTTSR